MVLALALSSAFAQDSLPVPVPELNAQLYHPPADSRYTLWTEDTSVSDEGAPIARLMFGYVHQPFVFVADDGTRVPLLDKGLGVNLVGGYSVDRFRVSADLPIWLTANTQSSAVENPSATGFGDLSVDVKGVGLDREVDPVGLALDARLVLPTSTMGDLPVGNGKVGWEVAAVVDQVFNDSVVVAANVGLKGNARSEMTNVTFGDSAFVRIGAGYLINEDAGLSADLAGHFSLPSFGVGAGTPVEGILGGWGRVGSDWIVRGGVGTGLSKGIGAPVARVLIGVGYEPKAVKDADMDGILDAVDACPLDAEDVDAFQDEDGCPELDNDSDGIADALDKCPLEPEDVDAWEDSDGCKEANAHVRVRIFDVQTGKPVDGVAVEVTGPQGVDGKFPGDDDFEMDLVPGTYAVTSTLEGWQPLNTTFEVVDGPAVEQRFTIQKDVVPGTLRVRVTDPDGNAIPTATYSLNDSEAKAFGESAKAELSLVPGGYVLMVRAEGFVPSTFPATISEGKATNFGVVLQPAKVKITKEKLDIKDKVFFETNKAIIKPESYKLLDEVALILMDRPDIQMMRIEGHTDSRGNDADNLKLSQARAESVRAYFIDKGVEPERLTAVGFGETRPLEPAENAAAWEKNRRVEFYIEKWAE